MSLGFLLLALQIGFAIHAYRTGRMNPWLWIIVFVPALGCLLYAVLELGPELVSGPTARRARRDVVTIVDPGRVYRQLAHDVQVAPTVHNKLKLAEECLRLGRTEEAAALYAESATGLYAADPSVLGGLAQARFATGDLAGARQALDAVRAESPDWRPADVQLLYARILEGQNQIPEALAALRALATTYPGEEARCRYADLLARSGDVAAARAEYREIVRRVDLQGRPYRRAQSVWYETARRALG